MTLNRKFFDIAKRNINLGFDFATGLAGAKNLAEVMQLQGAYWRELFGAMVQTDQKRERTKTPVPHKK